MHRRFTFLEGERYVLCYVVYLIPLYLISIFLFFSEGGRLEKELRYIRRTLGEGVGSTNQILIHTPKEEGANVLHPDILLAHLQVLKAAIQVSVEVFDM